MMQMKIIVILHVYLFFKQLSQTALPIISTAFLSKILKTPKTFFVLSPKLNFQGNWKEMRKD